MPRLQVQSKKRRLMRSPISERSKLMVDADLISQPVYVLDADDGDESNELLISAKISLFKLIFQE